MVGECSHFGRNAGDCLAQRSRAFHFGRNPVHLMMNARASGYVEF